jgi:hypothetical protein
MIAMMKTTFRLMLIVFSISFLTPASSQVVINGVSDSIAILNEPFSATVDYDYLVSAPSFQLLEAPAGMSINGTGIISWTPSTVTAGGKVIVRAWNGGGEAIKAFHVYVSDEVVCDTDLMGYWPMDYKDGTSLPDIANGFDADFQGTTEPEATISTDAMVGSSAFFDPLLASDLAYNVPEQDSFQFQYQDDFSVSFWFKNTAPQFAANHEKIIGRIKVGEAGWYIEWNNTSKKLIFFMRDNSSDKTGDTTSVTIPDNNWHHVAVTFDGRRTTLNPNLDSYLIVYVDKVSKTIGHDFNTDNFYNTADLQIGYVYPYSNPFSGYLDEVAYYDRVLTPSDVTSLYDKGIAGEAICSPGNIAPIITSAAVTTATQDIAYSYQLTWNELDGDPITLAAPVKPSWLTFNTGTGLLSGTPANANAGDTTVTLTVSDGEFTATQTFTLSVANVNDEPIITSTEVTAVDEDSPYSYTFAAMDIDVGDAVTLSAPVLPSWLTFNPSTGLLSGTPTNDQVLLEATADFNVTLRATDNFAEFVEQAFVITVTNINDAPVIDSQNDITTDEDVAILIDFSALNVTDVDNTYPDDFTLTVQNGSNFEHTGNTITPDENWNGTLTVPVELSDGDATVLFDLSVDVTAVNDVPVFTSTPVEGAVADVQYQYWIVAQDVEGSALTLGFTAKPDWLAFSSNAGSGLLQGTPTLADVGNHAIALEVTDGTDTTVQEYTLVVVATNWPPVITSNPATTANINEVYSYIIIATDEDADDLTYSAPTLPSWLTFNPGTRLLTGTPALADLGDHDVELAVTDGIVTEDQSFTITVVDPDGIVDNQADLARVYPMPANEYVVFDFGTTLNNVSIKIYNMSGNLIMEEQTNGQTEVNLNISALVNGQYIYVLTNDEGYQKGVLIKK